MANYELYPELTNKGVAMLAVPEDAFTHEVVTAEDGKEYDLLKGKEYPYSVLQVTECKDIDEFRRVLNAGQQQGWAEYVTGHTDHIVIHRGNWQQIELNQQNAQKVADMIHEDIRNGARWWTQTHSPALSR